jgi:hypothetical protein
MGNGAMRGKKRSGHALCCKHSASTFRKKNAQGREKEAGREQRSQGGEGEVGES